MTIQIPANIREGAQGTEDHRGPDQTTRVTSDGHRQLFGRRRLAANIQELRRRTTACRSAVEGCNYPPSIWVNGNFYHWPRWFDPMTASGVDSRPSPVRSSVAFVRRPSYPATARAGPASETLPESGQSV